MLHSNETIDNVIYPPMTMPLPFNYNQRSLFGGHVTINNDLVFIPLGTGDKDW